MIDLLRKTVRPFCKGVILSGVPPYFIVFESNRAVRLLWGNKKFYAIINVNQMTSAPRRWSLSPLLMAAGIFAYKKKPPRYGTAGKENVYED